MERTTVVVIGFLLAFTGAVQAAGPDIYDLAFLDDSKDTTINVLELNTGQDHTLDTAPDVDWAVLVLTGEDTFPYTVRVEQVGAGIDPAFVVLDDAGSTLTTDVFSGDPGFHDGGQEGEAETWSKQLAPGVYRIGVKHVGASYGASDAGYSLRVTQDTGAIPAASLRDDTRYTIVYIAYRDDGFGLEIASEPWVSLLGVSIRAEVATERWELYD